MTAPTRHVQRPTAVQGGLTHCACGEPWPCQHSAEGRLQELLQQVQQARNDYYEAACDHGELMGHGAQEERAWGAVQALDEVLGWLAPEGEQ